MNAAHRAAFELAQRLQACTTRIGRPVTLDPLAVLDRSAEIALGSPGMTSPNDHCRMLAAKDGWIALNLARPSDGELISAWIGAETSGDLWQAAARHAAVTPASELVAVGTLLGLPISRVGEVTDGSLSATMIAMGRRSVSKLPLTVLDLSSLWAGPLCGAILAQAGAQVTRVEDPARADPTRITTPRHFARLNRDKRELAFCLSNAEGHARLFALASTAQVLITSARPRAFASLGLDPERLFAANPTLTWVAITGYGWHEPHAARTAFGDDAAVAGGLVLYAQGVPNFVGDAVADPLTGMAAALAALEAVEAGGGVMVDAAMARIAAGAAALAK